MVGYGATQWCCFYWRTQYSERNNSVIRLILMSLSIYTHTDTLLDPLLKWADL